MLHKLWGKAQKHADYDKAEWMELQATFDALVAACKQLTEAMRHAVEVGCVDHLECCEDLGAFWDAALTAGKAALALAEPTP